MNEHGTKVIDRGQIVGWAKTGTRLVAEFTDKQGRRCVSVGYVCGLSDTQVILEACSRPTVITLDRLHTLAPVNKGSARRGGKGDQS